MPIIESDIQYEYPKTEGERLALIGKHAKEGRMWVSSSMNGHPYRMKFCEVSYTDSVGYRYVNGKNVGKARPS